MKATDAIVACGGWFKREIRFKPLHLLAGAAALACGLFTGVVGVMAGFIWFHDGVRPEAVLVKCSSVGAGLTVCLIVLTVFVGKMERERKITILEANQHKDPRCLY